MGCLVLYVQRFVPSVVEVERVLSTCSYLSNGLPVMETQRMQSRVSSQQTFFLRVLERAGPSTLGQLVWSRENKSEAQGWTLMAGELPTLPARENRSAYNSTRRSLDLLVEQGAIVKETDRAGQLRYRSSPPRHSNKTLALANLAQAKLGPDHYQRLLTSGATSKTVVDAICSTTGWSPVKTRTAVESIAKVLGD